MGRFLIPAAHYINTTTDSMRLWIAAARMFCYTHGGQLFQLPDRGWLSFGGMVGNSIEKARV